VVANSRKVQLIYGSEDKSDRADAERLARLARADVQLLAPVQHRSENAQRSLVPIKMRAQLVRMRTKAINFVRGSSKSFGIRLTRCDAEYFPRRARAQLPEELAPMLEPTIALVEQITTRIADVDELLERQTELSPAAQALTQITGVGALTAQTFIHTLDNPLKFKRSRAVGAYLGLTPRRAQSGKGDPQLRITKCGDTYLRSLLINCAHYIMGPFGPDTDLRRHGMRIAESGGKNGRRRALVAVARKLAVVMHRLWLTGEEYKPLGYAAESA
jgi:transposase